MRKCFQTIGRALYARSSRQNKVTSPILDPNIIPSPLPSPPQQSKPLSEALSDIARWQGIRLALKGLGQYLESQSRPYTKQKTPVLDLNVVLSPPTDHKLRCQSSDTKEVAPEASQSKDHATETKKPFHASTFDQLFTTSSRATYRPNNKVTVVGASDLGMATVFSLLAKGVTNDISMIDFSEDKLKGELMDLQSGSKFLPHARIRASKDYSISTDSKICVLVPCYEVAAQRGYDCVNCNAEVLKAVVPQLLRYSPECILVVALDPVDVFSYLTWRISELPQGRVVGTGTNLSSATFRYLLADRLGLAPSACSGCIIGEDGESSVPVWSGVTAGGVLLRDINPDIGTDHDPENWQEVHRQVLAGCQETRDLKGYNSWATALSITDICSAILNDANTVRPLSTYVKGEHNIDEDVFLSLPCVLGNEGVADVIRQPLAPNELELLRRSAEAVAGNLGTLQIKL